MATTLCEKIFICFHHCHDAPKTRNQSLKKINKEVRTVVTAKSTGETGLHERAQRFLVSHA
jgi:hypothetical protein